MTIGSTPDVSMSKPWLSILRSTSSINCTKIKSWRDISGQGTGNGHIANYLLCFGSGVLAKPLPGPASYSAIYHPNVKVLLYLQMPASWFFLLFAVCTSFVWLINMSVECLFGFQLWGYFFYAQTESIAIGKIIGKYFLFHDFQV